MIGKRIFTMAILAAVAVPLGAAQAGVFVRVGVGFPGPVYRPWFRPVVYVGPVYPAPAIVMYPAPTPVLVQPAPVYAPAAAQPAPLPAAPTPVAPPAQSAPY